MGEELNKDGEHSSEAIADNMGNANTGSASLGYTNGMGPARHHRRDIRMEWDRARHHRRDI